MHSLDFNIIPEKFVCLQCHACCRQAGFVWIHREDQERIADFLGMDVYAFTEKYCDCWGRVKLVLKKQKEEACIFLSDRGCRVHPVKPEQCRDFPFRWKTERSLDYCRGLKSLEEN